MMAVPPTPLSESPVRTVLRRQNGAALPSWEQAIDWRGGVMTVGELIERLRRSDLDIEVRVELRALEGGAYQLRPIYRLEAEYRDMTRPTVVLVVLEP